MNPLVSVIIPVYNSGDYLEESILSARNQTYKNIEVVVIDDGSNIATKNKLKEIASKIDILLVQENLGPSAARNNGIKNANGNYILILDSDDYYKPTFLEKAIERLENKPNVKFVSCYLNRFEGNKIGPIVKMNGGSLENYLFRNASIGNGLFRKKELVSVGGYDEQMRDGYVDWELILRLLKEKGGEVEIIPEPLFMYRSSLKLITNRAKKKRSEILTYIFKKHSDLYKDNFELLLQFFSKEQQKLISQKKQFSTGLDYKIGNILLSPIRLIKGIFKK